MSEIPPLAAPPSKGEDPAEFRRFEEAMAAPLKILAAIENGQPLELTEPHRFQVAQLCARSNVYDTARKIRSFVLNETDRFEIAKLCAQRSFDNFINNIDEFDLTREQYIEIVKLCIENDNQLILKDIAKFDLTQEQCIEVLKFCLQVNKSNIIYILRNISNFNLIGALHNELLKFYLESDVKEPFDIVHDIIHTIHNFDLTSEERLEILQRCLRKEEIYPRIEQILYHVVQNISKFDLLSEHQLELVQLCFEKKPPFIIQNINKFGVTSEQRLELAKLFANSNIIMTITMIDCFKLEDEHRFELAKFCTEKNCLMTASSIARFNLPEDRVMEILSFAVRENPMALSFIVESQNGVARCIAILSYMGWIKPEEWEELTRNFGPEMEATFIVRAAQILSVWLTDTPREDLRWLSEQKFLIKILETRALYLDLSLSRLAKEIARNPLVFADLKKQFLDLLVLPLAQLKSAGVNIGALQLNPKDLKDTKKFMPFLHAMCQLAEDPLLSPEKKIEINEAITKETSDLMRKIKDLNDEIVQLHEGDPGSRKKKRGEHKGLRADIPKAESRTLDSARDLSVVLGCRRSDLLQQHHVSDANSLKAVSSAAFQSVLPLPKPVDNFLGAYQRTFGAYRQSNAFQIYVAGFCGDARYRPVLISLGDHAFSIFTGTYRQDRYDPAKNSHLEVLDRYDPNLLPAWQVNSREPLRGVPGFSIYETDDPEDMLLCGTEVPGSCQMVFGDPSVNRGLVGYLRNGQTRLLAIKDSKGRIVARRILRLLWDNEAKRPVLFLEKAYPVPLTEKAKQLDNALIEKAMETAHRLNCSLTSTGLPRVKYMDYPHPIQSLGGVAPCEYVDGAGGVQEGPYSIHVSQLMYDPIIASMISFGLMSLLQERINNELENI